MRHASLLFCAIRRFAGVLRADARDLLTSPVPMPRPRDLDRREATIVALIALMALTLYGGYALGLAGGRYPTDINLAFDFDPRFYVGLLADPALAWGAPGTGLKDILLKHPLLPLLRPFGLALVALGATPAQAAAMLTATAGAATVPMFYVFARGFGVALPERLIMTALFLVSATPLFASVTPESYAYAGLGLAALFLCVLARDGDPTRHRRSRVVATLALYGVTATNLVQAVVAEIVLWVRQRSLADAIARVAAFAMIVLGLGVVVTVATHRIDWLAVLADPLGSLRTVLYVAPRGSGEKSPIEDLLLTYLGYSVVAPDLAAVMIEDGRKMMLDFRAFDFPPRGLIAAYGWMVVWVVGAAIALASAERRTVVLVLVACILFNLLLHLDYQFRGSLFVYGSHLHFAVMGLALGGARLAGRLPGPLRLAVSGSLAFLVVLVAENNLDRMGDFVAVFAR